MIKIFGRTPFKETSLEIMDNENNIFETYTHKMIIYYKGCPHKGKSRIHSSTTGVEAIYLPQLILITLQGGYYMANDEKEVEFDDAAGLFIYNSKNELVFSKCPWEDGYNIVDAWKENGEVMVVFSNQERYTVHAYRNGGFEYVRDYVR